jgi:hypothetical protein
MNMESENDLRVQTITRLIGQVVVTHEDEVIGCLLCGGVVAEALVRGFDHRRA